jgi:hypothetical protein
MPLNQISLEEEQHTAHRKRIDDDLRRKHSLSITDVSGQESQRTPHLKHQGRSNSHHRGKPQAVGRYEGVNGQEDTSAEHFEEFEIVEEGYGSQSEENGGESKVRVSNVTLALASIVASGVQFGWALQLSLLTPYIQVRRSEDLTRAHQGASGAELCMVVEGYLKFQLWGLRNRPHQMRLSSILNLARSQPTNKTRPSRGNPSLQRLPQ